MNHFFTFSSHEFARDVAAAKRAADEGTVFITERGHPAYVLLNIERYLQMTEARPKSLLTAMNEIASTEGIVFEPEKIQMDAQRVNLN